jgi:hypothetical protein
MLQEIWWQLVYLMVVVEIGDEVGGGVSTTAQRGLEAEAEAEVWAEAEAEALGGHRVRWL